MHAVSSWTRIAIGLLLVLAGVLKFAAGEGIAVEAMRMLDLADSHWSRVANAVRAIAVYELVLGIAMVAIADPRRWTVALGLLLAGFLAWDVGRFLTGGPVDCGCLGGIKLATAWGHVWLKQGLLIATFVVLARAQPSRVGGPRSATTTAVPTAG